MIIIILIIFIIMIDISYYHYCYCYYYVIIIITITIIIIIIIIINTIIFFSPLRYVIHTVKTRIKDTRFCVQADSALILWSSFLQNNPEDVLIIVLKIVSGNDIKHRPLRDETNVKSRCFI